MNARGSAQLWCWVRWNGKLLLQSRTLLAWFILCATRMDATNSAKCEWQEAFLR